MSFTEHLAVLEDQTTPPMTQGKWCPQLYPYLLHQRPGRSFLWKCHQSSYCSTQTTCQSPKPTVEPSHPLLPNQLVLIWSSLSQSNRAVENTGTWHHKDGPSVGSIYQNAGVHTPTRQLQKNRRQLRAAIETMTWQFPQNRKKYKKIGLSIHVCIAHQYLGK